MAQIPVKPLYLKDSTLKIEDDNFEAAASGVTFTPSTNATTWTGLTPTSTFSEQSTPTWVCGIDYVQDWETPGSLSRYFHENAGQQKAVTFEPKSGGPAVTANITIVPGPIGGSGGAFATASVSCGSDYPEIADAPAAGGN